MNQSDMLDMLKERVQQMEGGRRRRVGRPRKRRGGEIDGYEMSAMSELDGSGLVGGALVGGRRRVGRPRKGVIPPQFRAHIAALRRKKRGRGLVGGISAQEVYETYADADLEVPDKVLAYLKAGIEPMTKKQQLIKRIMRLEKKIGFTNSTEAKLNKYTIKALEALAQFYKTNGTLLAYPPIQGLRDESGMERFNEPEYVGITIPGDDGKRSAVRLPAEFSEPQDAWLQR